MELTLATGIMVAVTGSIFTMVNPTQGAFRVQPEVADMQQRLRVGVDMLHKDLVMAGAGTYSGAAVGALSNFFAPVLPYRTGLVNSDPAAGVYYRPDAISMTYVPNTASQTTISSPMPNTSAEIKVNALPGCPSNDPLCGFKTGQSILIFDTSGASDTFTITNVQSNALHLQHKGQQLSKAYGTDTFIAQAETHTYYHNSTTAQLFHYDGASSDLPLVDNVVGLTFRYFGTQQPPTAPKPAIGTANCLYDIGGNTLLPTLPGGDGSLVELTQTLLTDGPWCGTTNQFDADLYRIRKIRVDLRVQVGAEDLRGTDPLFFRRPGRASEGTRMVPDFELSFEVTPRNMNLMR